MSLPIPPKPVYPEGCTDQTVIDAWLVEHFKWLQSIPTPGPADWTDRQRYAALEVWMAGLRATWSDVNPPWVPEWHDNEWWAEDETDTFLVDDAEERWQNLSEGQRGEVYRLSNRTLIERLQVTDAEQTEEDLEYEETCLDTWFVGRAIVLTEHPELEADLPDGIPWEIEHRTWTDPDYWEQTEALAEQLLASLRLDEASSSDAEPALVEIDGPESVVDALGPDLTHVGLAGRFDLTDVAETLVRMGWRRDEPEFIENIDEYIEEYLS